MKKIIFIIAILVCFIHAQAETTTLYSLVPTKALDTLTVPANSTEAVYDECTGNVTLSPSGTKAYCGAYVSNKSNKEYKITYSSSALSFSANQIWLIMYSPTPFQAGDSITIKTTSSTTPLGKLFFAEFDEFTTDYYGNRASDSIAMANIYFNSASTSYEYGAKLPAGFTSSNYLVLGRNGSSFSVKNLKITRESACTSHSVTAATSTGNNTYGTVAAASASVCEGSTTTVTATPASGYQVTNWAVTGTGASVSPSGASNSNTTTLTMGTADATVTVTFGCKAPTSPTVSGTTAYTEGDDISLTASATGTSASVTYTWYKGATWDAASATSSIHSGAKLSINDCVEGNAGTYWCNISNGTGCDVQTSKTITVSGACTDPGLTITLN